LLGVFFFFFFVATLLARCCWGRSCVVLAPVLTFWLCPCVHVSCLQACAHGCGKKFQMVRVKHHEDNECHRRPMKCPRNCGTILWAADIADHLEWCMRQFACCSTVGAAFREEVEKLFERPEAVRNAMEFRQRIGQDPTCVASWHVFGCALCCVLMRFLPVCPCGTRYRDVVMSGTPWTTSCANKTWSTLIPRCKPRWQNSMPCPLVRLVWRHLTGHPPSLGGWRKDDSNGLRWCVLPMCVCGACSWFVPHRTPSFSS